jgi:hypothetical protein
MMIRFAKIDPIEMDKIQARQLDPIAMKEEWIAISDEAEEAMVRQADEVPDTPIGVAFVDREGDPGWIGNDPSLRPHHPCIRGCWPTVHLT